MIMLDRPPVAALCSVPGLIVLMLLGLCGCTSTYRRGVQFEIEHQYSVQNPQFLRSMGRLMGPGITSGNKVTSFINGDQIFPAMLEAIRNAKKSINLETYIYWSGEIGQEFAEALTERAQAGVKVHIIMDWIGSRRINAKQISLMRSGGVEVIRYNPLVWYSPLRLNHRDHRKLLIVDGKIGFTGGVGIADIWMGNANSPQHWRDSYFRLEGPSVGQMQAAFMDNWMKSGGRVLDGEEYFPELFPAGDELAQVFWSSPKDGAETARLMYMLSIAAAQKNIRMAASYFVPGKLTTAELIEACRRGVKIEIIMPGARSDSALVKHASRAKWGPLLKAGVKIYEYQPTMYHCKVMIVDDVWVSVGSANFDNRSFRLNDEANLNVYSRPFAQEQIRVFENDKRSCVEVSYAEWKRRGFYERLLEQLTAPFRSQL